MFQLCTSFFMPNFEFVELSTVIIRSNLFNKEYFLCNVIFIDNRNSPKDYDHNVNSGSRRIKSFCLICKLEIHICH